jgi:hypothetical protein
VQGTYSKTGQRWIIWKRNPNRRTFRNRIEKHPECNNGISPKRSSSTWEAVIQTLELVIRKRTVWSSAVIRKIGDWTLERLAHSEMKEDIPSSFIGRDMGAPATLGIAAPQNIKGIKKGKWYTWMTWHIVTDPIRRKQQEPLEWNHQEN